MRFWQVRRLLRKLLDMLLRVRRGPSALDNGDPLLALRGSGRELWADEHADEYVRRLRE